jgi:hypothetical protein
LRKRSSGKKVGCVAGAGVTWASVQNTEYRSQNKEGRIQNTGVQEFRRSGEEFRIRESEYRESALATDTGTATDH